MRVIVAAIESGCIAHRALQTEDVPHEEHVCVGENGYSDLLAGVWGDGRGFVLFEHDVVPWPGAVAALWACPRDWCAYRYPRGGGSTIRSLGCVKFSDRLVRDNPDLPSGWDGPWMTLENRVLGSVAKRLRKWPGQPVCKDHWPPVAHVQRID